MSGPYPTECTDRLGFPHAVTCQQVWDQFWQSQRAIIIRVQCGPPAGGGVVCLGDSEYGQCDVPADLGPGLAVSAAEFHSCAMRTDGQSSALEATSIGSVTCQQIWDQFWKSQRALFILVR